MFDVVESVVWFVCVWVMMMMMEEEEAEDASARDGARRATFVVFECVIEDVIEVLGGEVVLKFVWSVLKDVVWVVVGNMMKCRNADEVVLLFKASDAVVYDLIEVYGVCEDYVCGDGSEESEEDCVVCEYVVLVLMFWEWYDLNSSMEFRCFVKNRNLVVAS